MDSEESDRSSYLTNLVADNPEIMEQLDNVMRLFAKLQYVDFAEIEFRISRVE